MREESGHIKGLYCVCPVTMRLVMREENGHIKGGGNSQSVLQYNGDGGFLETIHKSDELVSETVSAGLLNVLTIYRREREREREREVTINSINHQFSTHRTF